MPRQDDGRFSISSHSHKKSLRSDSGTLKKLDFFVFILVFILLLVFSIHNFDSIGQDIGRHLKTGELIWQTKEVPTTNLFSFTEPDLFFTNHHWLSEVIFYKLFSWFGFTGLILTKAILILTVFFLLWLAVKNLAKFWPILISFLLSIFIFVSRTEVRPEIFSFTILALFLFILFREKYNCPEVQGNSFSSTAEKNFVHRNLSRSLWLLPLLQVLWVNLHIYFFIGPFLLLAFLIDRAINRKSGRGDISLSQFIGDKSDARKRYIPSPAVFSLQRIFVILSLVFAATLLNPQGIQGMLLPFSILKEYGYSIVENQTLSFLASFFGFNLSIFLFKLSVAILIGSFVLTIKKARQKIFEILISIFFIYAGFKMFRNLPLYALASFPVLAILLTDIFEFTKKRPEAQGNTFLSHGRFRNGSHQVLDGPLRNPCSTDEKKYVHRSLSRWISLVLKISLSVFLIIMIWLVVNGSFYKHIRSSKAFGLAVPDGLERATDFVKENKLKGPMFNNFDIGGYLIWKLYPEEKVFVDNRPEAYSVKFFTEIYKPMQEDKTKWAEFSKKYGINFIFFGHTDTTPWGQAFLKNMVKDPDWKMVYLNENAIVLVKNNQANSAIISRWAITEDNAVERASGDNLVLSRVFYNINWRKTALYFAEKAIKDNPADKHAYLNKGLVHAYYTDVENQKLAGENIQKAIDLGLKDSRYYTILGIVDMNLGRLIEAETWFEKALELDDKNEQAREFLSKYFKR